MMAHVHRRVSLQQEKLMRGEAVAELTTGLMDLAPVREVPLGKVIP